MPSIFPCSVVSEVFVTVHDVANLAFEELVSLFADELLKGQDGSDRPALELATALTSGAFSVGAETLVLGSQPVAVDGVADRLYREGAARAYFCIHFDQGGRGGDLDGLPGCTVVPGERRPCHRVRLVGGRRGAHLGAGGTRARGGRGDRSCQVLSGPLVGARGCIRRTPPRSIDRRGD